MNLHLMEWATAVFGNWQSWLSGGGLGGAIFLLINLYERLNRQRWRMPKKWYAYICLLAFFVGANYKAWQTEYDARTAEHGKFQQLQADFNNLSKPKLHGNIVAEAFGNDNKNKNRTLLVLWVAIENQGADSIINQFRLKVNGSSGIMPQDLRPTCMAGRLGPIPNKLEDSIIQKTSENPIPRGGNRTGIIHFWIDSPESLVMNPLTHYILEFTDIAGTVSSVDFYGQGKTGIHNIFVPGTSLPLPATKWNCTTKTLDKHVPNPSGESFVPSAAEG